MTEWKPNPGSQEKALESNAFELFYGGAAGGGKGISLAKKCLTDSGWKEAGKITLRDRLVSVDGTFTQIMGIYPQGLKQTYQFVFDDGAMAIVDESHLWTVFSAKHGWRDGWIVRDTTTLFKSKTNFAIPLLSAPAPGLNHLKFDAYILGYLIGNGTLTSEKPIIYTADKDIADYLRKSDWLIYKYRKNVWQCCASAPIARMIRSILPKMSKQKKHVPIRILEAHPTDRLALLQGLMDSDGTCAKDGSCSFSTMVPQLARDVCYLVRSLGGKSSIERKKRVGGGGENLFKSQHHELDVRVSHCGRFLPFRLARKAERVKKIVREDKRYIHCIKKLGMEETVCFRVAHPSCLFVIEDFIVTHNSQFLLVDALNQIDKPNYRAALFRRTFPELEKSLILDSRVLYPSMGGSYNEQKHRWTFKSGATIEFGYIDTLADVFNYQSAQYAYLGFDEATHFTEFQIEYMKSRCRCADPSITKFIRYASNPGNRGHSYFKKRFIENKQPYKKYVDLKTGLTSCFIPSKVTDNVVLMNGDPDYVKRLEGLPEMQKKMLLYGDWDVFQGQYFTEWSSEKHIVQPFEIPVTWKRARAIDHGRTAPTACMWGAIDHDGKIYWYREYYKAGQDADLNAQEIARLSQGESYAFTVLDSACFSKTGTGETIAEIYQRNGVTCEPSPKNRLAGWQLVHEYLRHYETSPPKMVFFSNCHNAIATIPELIHDERHPEDLDSSQNNDHCIDATSYFLQSLHESKSPKPLDPVEEKLLKLRNNSMLQPRNLNSFYTNSKR